MVLDRSEIPLHTNGSENDIRCPVTRRKISAGTRSDIGQDCRDAFLGLIKTCDKLGIALWDYLGSRFNVMGNAIVVSRLTFTSGHGSDPLDRRQRQYFVRVIYLMAGVRGTSYPVPVVMPLLLFQLTRY